HFYGHLGAAVDFYEHVLRGGLDWQRNGKSLREEGYTTDLITAEAVRLLRERDKNKPVLLYITYNAVHIPLQAPESYIDKYANIADEERRVLAAMTDAMDAGIGKVLTTLDDEGMTPDTLVLFMSDNGGGVGASNAPLRLGKGTVFEGGIRVPAAISWPGVLNGGSKSSQFITAHDWLPTLAAAAGIRVGNKKPLYGENLWPQIRDGETVARKDLLIGTRNSMALFHQEWKLIEVTLRGGEKRTFLFRINDDPNEQNNLAEDNQEIVRELSAKIEAFPRGRPVSGDAGGRRRRPGAGQRPGRGRGTQQGPPGLSVDRGGDPGGGPETREPYAEAAARN
ncbi:MAG: sulfatase-like hydrolase/transferase, partial [bacterium]|nr:sulfatase-like hydrolase/transferase [bacterium]